MDIYLGYFRFFWNMFDKQLFQLFIRHIWGKVMDTQAFARYKHM